MACVRAATPVDAGALAALEAACEPREACRVGAAVLGQRCACSPSHYTVATDGHAIVGAVQSVRFASHSELIGINSSQVQDLHREDGELLLLNNIWLASHASIEVEAQLLRYVMLQALKAGNVRKVVLLVPCSAKISAIEDQDEALTALRQAPHVLRQIGRGGSLLQQLLPAWWPAQGSEPAGAQCLATPPHDPCSLL